GFGRFAAAPAEDTDYRRGYLCGMVRGDAYRGEQFRLAPVDFEALERAQLYLAELGLVTYESLQAVAPGYCPIRTQSRAAVTAIRRVSAWPWQPSDQWARGFLAGIFDAEGSCSRGIWRLSDADRAIIERICACLRALGFDFVVEDPLPPNGLRC